MYELLKKLELSQDVDGAWNIIKGLGSSKKKLLRAYLTGVENRAETNVGAIGMFVMVLGFTTFLQGLPWVKNDYNVYILSSILLTISGIILIYTHLKAARLKSRVKVYIELLEYECKKS